jgi:hypothetical protein
VLNDRSLFLALEDDNIFLTLDGSGLPALRLALLSGCALVTGVRLSAPWSAVLSAPCSSPTTLRCILTGSNLRVAGASSGSPRGATTREKENEWWRAKRGMLRGIKQQRDKM